MTVKDLFDDIDDFEDMLDTAEGNAVSEWQINFVDSIRSKYQEFRGNMFLSEKQLDVLKGMQ